MWRWLNQTVTSYRLDARFSVLLAVVSFVLSVVSWSLPLSIVFGFGGVTMLFHAWLPARRETRARRAEADEASRS